MMCRNPVLTPLLCGLLAAVSITACAAQAGPPSAGKADQGKPVGNKAEPVSVRVSTDKKVYAAGEPIRLTLTAKNITKEALHVVFNTGQRYDFEIRRGAKPDYSLVWQWSRGMMFTMMVSSETLQPGKALVYNLTYDPKAAGHARVAPLAPGVYNVVGTLTIGQPVAMPHDFVTFRVK
jgi:hypothetical protein